MLEFSSGVPLDSAPHVRRSGFGKDLSKLGKLRSFSFYVPFEGQYSHFTTSSEQLAKTISEFVVESNAGGIAEQHPQLVKDVSRIRDFNATFIHCSLYHILSSSAPALHEAPASCPVSLVAAGSFAGSDQDYTMAGHSKQHYL